MIENDFKHLNINPDNPFWPVTGKTRVLIIAVNIPGYYSLPVRILALMIGQHKELKEKFDSRFIEFENSDNLNTIFNITNTLKPDIIGFSVNIWNRDLCFDLAGEIKKALPKTKNILGGQEVTNSSMDYLSDHPEVDYIIDGEGEIPLKQFLMNWDADRLDISDPENISGFRYRKNNKSCFTGPSDLLDHLDDVPSPILAGLIDADKKYKLGIMIEGTRGCPFKCSFCFEGGKRAKARTASLERMSREVEYMASKGTKYFHIMDPILCNSDPQRLKGLAALFNRINDTYKNIVVSVEAYAHHITREVAQSLKSFRLIDIGLQTLNPETAKAIHRPWQPEKFKKGLNHLRENKAPFTIYLICGLPHETLSTFVHGMCHVINEKPAKLFFNELLLLTGTELRKNAIENGYQFNPNPPYEVYASKWMDENDFKLAILISKDVEKRFNLSARSIHTSAPWIPQKVDQHREGIKIIVPTHCSNNCPGCRVNDCSDPLSSKYMQSRLDQAENRDIEIVIGDRFEKKELLKVIGQFMLAGSSRIKLTAPFQAINNEEWVNVLIKRGVWHFKSFLFSKTIENQLPENDCDKIIQALSHFDNPVDFRGNAQIKPHVELVVLYDESTTLKAYAKTIGNAAKPFISVLTVPDKACEKFNGSLEDLLNKGLEKDTWVKLPEHSFQSYFSSFDNNDQIVHSLNELDMVSHAMNQPPCFR
ncbi:MAG: radical SAM protein [Pseudomonadota bacterium]